MRTETGLGKVMMPMGGGPASVWASVSLWTQERGE